MDERVAEGPFLRLRQPEDVAEIRDLMVRVYPPPHGPEAIWSAENLLRHLEHFHEGQLVVEAGRNLVGTAWGSWCGPCGRTRRPCPSGGSCPRCCHWPS